MPGHLSGGGFVRKCRCAKNYTAYNIISEETDDRVDVAMISGQSAAQKHHSDVHSLPKMSSKSISEVS